MTNIKRKFFYQPGIAGSIIDWCWTIIVLLLGVIYWLEITHFQMVTLAFFVVFAILVWVQIVFRKLIVTNKTMRIKRVFNPKGKVIKLKNISHLKTRRYQLVFQVNDKQFAFLMPSNSIIEIKELIKQAKEQDRNEV